MSPPVDTTTPDRQWAGFFQLGAITALIIALAALADVLSTMLPGGYIAIETIEDWFAVFERNWLLGLRDLGLLDIIVMSLNIPIFFALFGAHRQNNHTSAAFAVVLTFIGTAVFLSNNVAFPMLALSREYAAATTEAQRTLIAAAGQSLLAVGEHSSPGTFMGYLFNNTAAILIGVVMLRGGIFRKLNGWTTVIGFSLLLIFNFCAAFIPAIYDTALIFAGIGGLLFIVTYVMIALKLRQLSKEGI
ncbi:MAG: DUF4386 family protein [Anaerolineae bacterium]|nr:DUF4386 family protein [Anaerolineae bacterium]